MKKFMFSDLFALGSTYQIITSKITNPSGWYKWFPYKGHSKLKLFIFPNNRGLKMFQVVRAFLYIYQLQYLWSGRESNLTCNRALQRKYSLILKAVGDEKWVVRCGVLGGVIRLVIEVYKGNDSEINFMLQSPVWLICREHLNI